MTNKEKFEQWWGNPRESLTSDMTQEQKVNTWVWEAWQAAKQESAAEIAELKDTLDAIRRHRVTYEVIIGERESTIAQLQERLTAYDKWLSEGVYYTTAEAFELHDGYNSKIAQLQLQLAALEREFEKLKKRWENK